MSVLGTTLFDKRNEKPEEKANYLPFCDAVFGRRNYDPAVNEDKVFAQEVQESFYALCESNPFGALQWYYMEERFLHGKSNEALAQEIIANVELLLKDLENISIRFLRHPENFKPMKKALKPYIPAEEEE